MDKYQRVKTIGKGAFGEAVLVKSTVDGNLYVSKEINLSALSKKDRDATDTEINILATVDHPNITKYIESIQDGKDLYIILEYADGGDLHDMIKRQTQAGMRGGQIPFPEHQIRNWFVQICLALQELHSKKVLHRDLKTRNVFMTKSGQIKLGDFGLSTVLKNSMAQANTLCGTPYYFSPELCRNKPYNSKSDVWALGCILYEMCTLKHAFDGKNMKALMQKILKGVYPPISSSYSQELANLIKLMLVRDETKRPSVTQILEQPWMQTSLKMLVHNLSQMTEEEEAETNQQKQKTAELMAEATRNIQGAKPPAEPEVNQEEVAKQTEVMKSMVNADRSALRNFLKGPPPAEIEAEIQSVLKANEEKKAQEKAEADKGAAAGSAVGNAPVAEKTLPEVAQDEGDFKIMKLAKAQFATIQQQISRLMCRDDGKRSEAGGAEEAESQSQGGDPEAVAPEEQKFMTAEGLRKGLLEELGEAKFTEAYNLLKAVTEADDEEDVMKKTEAILGDKAAARNMITQLIHFEDDAAA